MKILATIPVYTYPFYCNILFAIAACLILGGVMLGTFIAIEEKSWTVCIVGLSLFAIGIVGINHSSALIKEQETFDYNKYKVTIDETLNAKEFLNQYEILSREGEIFTIKEIEVDE